MEQGVIRLAPGDPAYPAGRLAALGQPALGLVGAAELLRRPLVALFCSRRCPGELILRTYDLARRLRDAGVAVISGFHTPMEREALHFLLKGQPAAGGGVGAQPGGDARPRRLPRAAGAGQAASRLGLWRRRAAHHRRAGALAQPAGGCARRARRRGLCPAGRRARGGVRRVCALGPAGGGAGEPGE